MKKAISDNNGQELTERQRRLIPFMVAAPTIEEGCRNAGISTPTYYEYLKDPVFLGELQKTRDQAVSDAVNALKHAANKAVTQLVVLLDSKSEEVRRKTAVDILNFITKWREVNEVEEKIIQIERLILERRTYR